MRRSLTLEYWQDEDYLVGRLLEVPGVFSQGKDLEDLESNFRDAFALVLTDQKASAAPDNAHRKEIEVEV